MNTSLQNKQSSTKTLTARTASLLLLLITLLVIIIFSWFYWQKISNREKLANLLPADRTVAFLEFNFSPGREDGQELLEIVRENSQVAGFLDGALALIPNPDLFDTWYSGRGGVAVLTSASGQDFQPVLLLGKTDQNTAAEWVKTLPIQSPADAILDRNYLGQKIISFKNDQHLHILWTTDYLVFAEQDDVLEAIAETMAGGSPSLRQTPDFNKLAGALPEQNLGFLYLNRSQLLATLTKNEQFLTGRLAIYKLYFPFLNVFSSEAMTVGLRSEAGKNSVLDLKHLALYNTTTAKSEPFPFTAVQYGVTGQLTSYLPSGTLAWAAGNNLLDQSNRMQTYFQDGSELNSLMFTGLLSSLEDGLGSPESHADLQNNFLQLFQNEYLVYLSRVEGRRGPRLGLIINTLQAESDAVKVKKLLWSIAPKIASQSLAKPVTMILPDGTKAEEIKADPVNPEMLEETISGQTVSVFQIAPDLIIYLWFDTSRQLLAVCTSPDDLEQIITTALQREGAPNEAQQRALGQKTAAEFHLDNPGELYYADLGNLAFLFPELAIWKPLQTLHIARKFTEIGQLSTYQLAL